jgi:hypothetical protein
MAPQRPGAKSEEHMQQEQKFAAVYGDFVVDVFYDDTATVSAPGGEVFSVKAEKPMATDEERHQFGSGIFDSVMSDGLVRTALKYKGSFSKKVADSVEGAMFDMKGGRPMSSGGALEGHMEPQREVHQEGSDVPVRPGATKDYDDDMQATRPDPKNSIESRDTDMADEAKVQSPTQTAVEGHEEPQREKRPEYSKEQNGLAGGTTDMKANAGGDSSLKIASAQVEPAETKQAEVQKTLERQRKLHTAQLEKLQAEHKASTETLLKAEREKIFRALRVAQRRGALNLEESPLKTTMLDSMTVGRTVGRSASSGMPREFAGLDDLESAWADASAKEIENLINRTAELLTYDEKYLISAEKDLSKQAATIPQVFEEDQLNPVDNVSKRAASLRAEMSAGNLNLAPGMTDSGAGEDKLNAIRAALGPTRVGRLLRETGASEDFRPSA